MAVLLIAEINDGALAMDATAKAVTAAKALGDVTVLACGASAKAAADEAATIDGVAKVLCAEDDLYGHRLAEPVAALIVYGRRRGRSVMTQQLWQWAIMMFVFGFLMPGINNWAHAGGFAGGWGCAYLMGFIDEQRESTAMVLLAFAFIGVTAIGIILSFTKVTGILLAG